MIYFDNAATTSPFAVPKTYYNPSSPHTLGISAERALRDARKTVATVLCNPMATSRQTVIDATIHIPAPDEVIFTSGGTESNNLAILGCALTNQRHGIDITSKPYEHPSILAPIRFAQDRGWAGQSQSKTSLLCISHVNHETGDINDIGAIATQLKKNNPYAMIHVDGAQGLCKEDINLHNIDMYSFSGHKVHGPTGTGGLWVKKGVNLTPLLYGGGQEGNLRSGTENVTGIIQMATAIEYMHKEQRKNHSHVTKLKSTILNLQNALPDVHVSALGKNVSPYIINISFLGVKGEILVHALSEKGVYVSMGAACNSRKRVKSALEIMGFPQEIAQSAIRLSFSPLNTQSEAEQACDIIYDTVKRLRFVMRK